MSHLALTAGRGAVVTGSGIGLAACKRFAALGMKVCLADLPGSATSVNALISGIEGGDFYILCPDNEVTPEMDRKRILWGAGDITESRPPLSRWISDYHDACEAFDP